MDLLETGFVATFGEGRWFSTEIKLRNFSVRDESSGKMETLKGKDLGVTRAPRYAACSQISLIISRYGYNL